MTSTETWPAAAGASPATYVIDGSTDLSVPGLTFVYEPTSRYNTFAACIAVCSSTPAAALVASPTASAGVWIAVWTSSRIFDHTKPASTRNARTPAPIIASFLSGFHARVADGATRGWVGCGGAIGSSSSAAAMVFGAGAGGSGGVVGVGRRSSGGGGVAAGRGAGAPGTVRDPGGPAGIGRTGAAARGVREGSGGGAAGARRGAPAATTGAWARIIVPQRRQVSQVWGTRYEQPGHRIIAG